MIMVYNPHYICYIGELFKLRMLVTVWAHPVNLYTRAMKSLYNRITFKVKQINLDSNSRECDKTNSMEKEYAILH